MGKSRSRSDAIALSLTQLTRLAQRRPHTIDLLLGTLYGRLDSLAEAALEVGIETGDPIGQVLAGLVQQQADYFLARRLMRLCNEPTHCKSVPLWEVSAVATEIVYETYSAAYPEPDEEQGAELAKLALMLGTHLNRLGEWEADLELTRAAVERFRFLAASCPRDYERELAKSLNNLGSTLDDLGRLERALEAYEEALVFFRRLSPDPPEA